jgi:hypothetical protein
VPFLPLQFRNLVATNNVASCGFLRAFVRGGALYAVNCNLHLRDNTVFRNNSGTGDLGLGGALFLVGTGASANSVTILDTTFTNNELRNTGATCELPVLLWFIL